LKSYNIYSKVGCVVPAKKKAVSKGQNATERVQSIP
jgi:hypothetical protein